MSTPAINAAKLAYRNECALSLHYIDRGFLAIESLAFSDEEKHSELSVEEIERRARNIARVKADDIAEAAANFGCLLDTAERARETGLVSLEELAFTDKIATPGGVYIDPNIPDPED